MNIRLVRIIAVIVVLVSGPTLGRERDDGQAAFKASVKSTLLIYKTCMEFAAYAYAPSDASPSDLADAAQSKCSTEFHSYKGAVTNYFSSMVSRSGISDAQEQAVEHSNETKARAKEMVIRLIVEGRLKTSGG